MPAFRKRTYATAFRPQGRMRKRTRYNKRKFARKSRKTTDFTTFNQRSTAIGFRGKKTSRRAYNKHIWNSTIFKPHYRSYISQDLNLTTPAAVTDGTLQFFNMYQFGGNGFATAAGGAVEIDVGSGLPVFADSSYILRGGRYEMTISNPHSFDIQIKMWRITTVKQPDFTCAGALGSSEDFAWDPSCTPDFYNYIGKPFGAKEVTINGGDQWTYSTRFKTQKIDTENYNNNAMSPYVLIFVTARNANTSAANVKVLQSYNLSYSADAIA